MNEKKTVEAWIEEKKIDPMIAAAARAYHRWPIGLELEEDDFAKAIDTGAKSTRLGSARELAEETEEKIAGDSPAMDTAVDAGKE